MEFTDYMWIKFGLVVFAAFIYGLLGGDVTGDRKEAEPSERRIE